ncbi:hypothetical protein [Streptacidiphilus sp. EB103A]|uniref:hypothetical protein n=1 Tax=Streptacidiphilus sp. EB103A TaxID=3156275 RepID=UPI003514D31A
MGLQSTTPLTVDQLLNALAAVGRGHIADPDQRPDGPTEQDIPELLGALLGLAETEVATVVDVKQEPPVGLHGLQEGWQHTSADRDVHRAVLINRLNRTAFDVPVLLADVDLDDDEAPEPPGVAGASASVMAAASLVEAQDHLDNGRRDYAHLALDSAEGSLAQALITLHLMRIQIRAGRLKE